MGGVIEPINGAFPFDVGKSCEMTITPNYLHEVQEDEVLLMRVGIKYFLSLYQT